MDKGQQETEALLKRVERQINKEYKAAIEEMEEQLHDYFERFEKKDETWRKWVENGTRTKEEYREWRYGQMAVGRRWQDQINSLAERMAEANATANGIVKKYTPEMYAENYNYSTYEIEKAVHIDTSFNLVNAEAVERIMKDDPEVLPPPGKQVSKAIAEGKAVRWNRQQVQSVMLQGLLQGDSIPKLATRLATTVGDRNRKTAIRNARTMATGAQNAGRVDAYKRAKSKGVDMEQMWLATLDNRTRHSHRWLDREVRPVGEEFSNGCEYPGDPKGDPSEIYNCRCSIRGVVKGLDRISGKFRDDSAIEGMSYDEWRKARSKSNPITLPEEKAKNIKQSYLAGYRGNGTIDNNTVLNRARNTNTIEDLQSVSNSPVIQMESYEAIKAHFAQSYGIRIEGFEGKDLFAIKATMAGYDDMLSEFPETQGILRSIVFNSDIPDCGNWNSRGKSEVGSAGLKDYGTGVHETAHVLDNVRGYNYTYSGKVIEQARKNLGYRANGKDYKDEWTRICGMPNGIKERDAEKFAYAMETAKGGGSSKLAQEIYRIAKEGK